MHPVSIRHGMSLNGASVCHDSSLGFYGGALIGDGERNSL